MTRSGEPPYCPDLGDLIFLEFSPHVGTEQGFTRPGLVLTPRAYNGLVGRCFACPVTNRGRGYPYEVALPAGLRIHGFVLADQGKPLSWAEHHARFADVAPETVIEEVKAKIAAFLQLA
ncbi:type II toxin-antitoxin system PemK/MazF family toxin [Methylobacterium trifolii]|uniref:Endoribonuclease toxin MazF n=1 Tax=Methylobacterium trifolii TaxID=1003092 RepID=A0ABQ4U190_9HYPH|nr:type II toxin-antitoxin system PemK/MazF family toxin [Methylobacterium trifolii]GJE61240.1 Endoribonuclease toxin MazF [Methylobacterium trifolii]